LVDQSGEWNMWELLIPFAKELIERFIPNPTERLAQERALAELEAQARDSEAKAEAARAAEFASYIAATQPTPDRVYVWANTLIALIRPVMAVFSLLAPFLWVDQWTNFIKVVAEGAPWSIVALSPMVVWILGRDGLRMVLGLASVVKNGGKIPQEVLPDGLEKIAPPRPSGPFTSGSGFKKEPPNQK